VARRRRDRGSGVKEREEGEEVEGC